MRPGTGARAPLPAVERPPDLDTLVRDGLPATEETADPTGGHPLGEHSQPHVIR